MGQKYLRKKTLFPLDLLNDSEQKLLNTPSMLLPHLTTSSQDEIMNSQGTKVLNSLNL